MTEIASILIQSAATSFGLLSKSLPPIVLGLVLAELIVVLNAAEPKDILCFAKTDSGASDIVSGDRHPRLREWKGGTTMGSLLVSGVLG